MLYQQYILLLFLSLGLIACHETTTHHSSQKSVKDTTIIAAKATLHLKDTLEIAQPTKVELAPVEPFDRTLILNQIGKKIQDRKPLIIHVFVPLCDNKYQGIVPVSKSLGDGQNPTTNLYWGAMYGIKTYFKRSQQWKLRLSERPTNNKTILERVVFEHTGEAKVYLIADAYDGSEMKACLNDFFGAVSGIKQAQIKLGDTEIPANGYADLVVFNGHNGLMDLQVVPPTNTNGIAKDAAVIACVSQNYFNDQLLKARAYPLVMTTQFMAPEAYVLEGIVNSWLQQKSAKIIHLEAAKAYHKYQKCGLNGAKKLFSTGF